MQSNSIKISTGIIIIALSILLPMNDIVSAMDEEENDFEKNSSSLNQILVPALMKCGGRLLEKVKKDENLIMSPLSIHQALGMVLLGAEEGSSSESQLLDVMGFEGSREQATKAHELYGNLLRSFNEINRKSREMAKQTSEETLRRGSILPPILDFWSTAIVGNEMQLQPKYTQSISDHYNSSIKKVDPQNPEMIELVAKEINDWGKEAGFGQDLVKASELREDPKSMTLMTAVYLEAFWEKPFWEFDDDELFYNYGRHDQPAQKGRALSSSQIYGNYIKFSRSDSPCDRKLTHPDKDLEARLSELDFHAMNIELEGKVTFTIIEPLKIEADPKESALDKLMHTILDEKKPLLGEILNALDNSRARFDHLQIPKFKFENDIDLKEVLINAGLKAVFDQKQTSLTNIAEMANTYVKKAKHQAVIDVTKAGIKAAAVTKMQISLLSSLITECPLNVFVRHPFMFLIRYGKIPLFIGRLKSV